MNGEEILSADLLERNGPHEQYDHGNFNALYCQHHLLAAVYNRRILVVADNYRRSPTERAWQRCRSMLYQSACIHCKASLRCNTENQSQSAT